ncbi:flagellar hook-associated protein FlgL [Alkalihalophilus marmarensis]|uniref:flagellar hook-associated protein FlgL n=1 Tax=Alkalihalophilus marmarensis TaxID=521377 RepID=UPI00203A8771|nr:flagellar hook-associated protein FlgL [Alkalihalophilus marmarensis]MCM3489926.1 flagellar hook-associated protein FlgL [Alkalihalophilus marmarensis]
MRVTQMMLSTNSLKHINQGYNRLATLQDQLSTGKRITKASQDPVIAMKGMRYRSQVNEVEQFQRNLREVYSWMDAADSALDEATQAVQRIRELATQAANDTYEGTQRANIAKEIKQLREHIQSLANTKNSTKFIFNGTNTTKAPIVDMEGMDLERSLLFNDPDGPDPAHSSNINDFNLTYGGRTFQYVGTSENDELIFLDTRQIGKLANSGDVNVDEGEFNEKAFQLKITKDGIVFSEPAPKPVPGIDDEDDGPTGPLTKTLREEDVIISRKTSVSANTQSVEIELMKGVTIPVNINASSVFSTGLFGDIIRLEKALENPSIDGTELTGYIDDMFGHIDNIVSERAELGARINRVEMIENRLMEQNVFAKRIMSDNEDVDLERVIIDLTTQESVHRAALAVGARVIQPSLMDFLR